MTEQLQLFQTSQPVAPEPVWMREAVDRSGPAAYIHLIRNAGDPERLSRDERKRLGLRDPEPHRTIDKTPVGEWTNRVLKHLTAADGRPMTFNRLSLEMVGVTADIAFGTHLDAALWRLVAEGRVEHSMQAPIMFRMRRGRQ